MPPPRLLYSLKHHAHVSVSVIKANLDTVTLQTRRADTNQV
jgi:hypothetical protein